MVSVQLSQGKRQRTARPKGLRRQSQWSEGTKFYEYVSSTPKGEESAVCDGQSEMTFTCVADEWLPYVRSV